MRDLTSRPDLVCINTGTLGYRFAIEDIIKECSARGIGWISPWRRELEGRDLKILRRLLADSGIKVASLCRSTYYTGDSAAKRQNAVEENKRAVEQAAELGALCYMQVVGSLYPGKKDLTAVRAQAAEGLCRTLETAKACGVPLAVEALHPMTCADRSCVTTLREALDLCDMLDPGFTGMGVAVDAYHVWWDAYIHEQIKRAGRRILGFHVSDWLPDTADLVNDRGMPGDGVIDLKALRQSVEEAGYAGPVELEVFSVNNWWKMPLGELLDASLERIFTYC